MTDTYNAKQTELLAGMEFDTATGNYRATETAASEYDSSDTWQDANGQTWVDGNVVAEVLSDAGDKDA